MMRLKSKKTYVSSSLGQVIMDCRVKPGNDGGGGRDTYPKYVSTIFRYIAVSATSSATGTRSSI